MIGMIFFVTKTALWVTGVRFFLFTMSVRLIYIWSIVCQRITQLRNEEERKWGQADKRNWGQADNA